MKPIKHALLGISLLLLFLLTGCLFKKNGDSERTLLLKISITNPNEWKRENAEVLVNLPMSTKRSEPDLKRVEAPARSKLFSDAAGLNWLVIPLQSLSPNEKRELLIKIPVHGSSSLFSQQDDEVEPFLNTKALASNATATSADPEQTLKALAQTLSANNTQRSFDDFSFQQELVQQARTAGIPARVVAGFSYRDDWFLTDRVLYRTQFFDDFNWVVLQSSGDFLPFKVVERPVESLWNGHGVATSGPLERAVPTLDNLTWSGERTIDQTIVIPQNASLTILAGTKLRFTREARLVIQGKLQCNGTSSAPIEFHPLNKGDTWQGLQIRESKSADLNFVSIKSSESDGIFVENSAVRFHQLLVTNSAKDGIRIVGRENGRIAQIEQSKVERSGGNGISIEGTDALLKDNTIRNNGAWGVFLNSTASGSRLFNNLITNNQFSIHVPPDAYPDATNQLENNFNNWIGIGDGIRHSDWEIGVINVNQKSEINSFVVDGKIQIPHGVTLRLTPGTRLLFDSSLSKIGSLLVNGHLEVRGSSVQPVRFMRRTFPMTAHRNLSDADNQGFWNGIEIAGGTTNATASFEHAMLSGGGSKTGMLSLIRAEAVLHSVDLFDSPSTGLYLHDAKVSGKIVRIFANRGAGLSVTNGEASLKWSQIFANNERNIKLGTSGRVELPGSESFAEQTLGAIQSEEPITKSFQLAYRGTPTHARAIRKIKGTPHRPRTFLSFLQNREQGALYRNAETTSAYNTLNLESSLSQLRKEHGSISQSTALSERSPIVTQIAGDPRGFSVTYTNLDADADYLFLGTTQEQPTPFNIIDVNGSAFFSFGYGRSQNKTTQFFTSIPSHNFANGHLILRFEGASFPKIRELILLERRTEGAVYSPQLEIKSCQSEPTPTNTEALVTLTGEVTDPNSTGISSLEIGVEQAKSTFPIWQSAHDLNVNRSWRSVISTETPIHAIWFRILDNQGSLSLTRKTAKEMGTLSHCNIDNE